MKAKQILYGLLMALVSCGTETVVEKKEVVTPKSATDYANEIIQPPADYWPISSIEGEIESNPYKDAERHSFNLVFITMPTDSVAYTEMRYWLYDVWLKYKYSNALYVKCFDNSKGDAAMAFATGTFAPEGNWSKADPDIWIDQYELNLKYIGE